MIDVFVRVYLEEDMRLGFAIAAIERWKLQSDARVTLVCVHNTVARSVLSQAHKCSWINNSSQFHIDSKRKAEELAQSEIYCVIDDDQLILGQDFIRKGVENLGNHPQYGMLSATSISDGIFPEGRTRPSCDVVEMHAIGCPYFVRKGTLKEFPKGPKEQYDGILSKVVTDQGLKTGLMPYVRYNHLGAGYSKVCPEHWSA